MRELFRLLELAAASEVTVLLQGESGTGKELAAGAIHDMGNRRDGPLVRVNCGALPESILESELFGHVKGAFTGAHRDRVGRFEAADGGTIFLDEIGEISPATQVKLLRVLQEHTYERVGDSRPRHADVRVVAATNRDLAQEVRQGRFREDLYYRLRVFPIEMPALRERIDDIPALVQHFVAKFRRKTGRSIQGFDPQAMRAAMDYCWPGNVRELENAVEYAFVTCQGTTIELFDLPQELRRFELRRSACGDGVPDTPPAPVTPGSVNHLSVVRDPEELTRLLEECDWNKAEVGRRLGISRTAVWKWMRRHGMPLQRPEED
jgi:transcriptional regulator with GAF, ATPase, and Fis domain